MDTGAGKPRHSHTQWRQLMASYEQIRYDGDDIQRLLMPDIIVLDEAQRIKNWQTKTLSYFARSIATRLTLFPGALARLRRWYNQTTRDPRVGK